MKVLSGSNILRGNIRKARLPIVSINSPGNTLYGRKFLRDSIFTDGHLYHFPGLIFVDVCTYVQCVLYKWAYLAGLIFSGDIIHENCENWTPLKFPAIFIALVHICCKSLVLCNINGNELRKIDLITGSPLGINPSLINLCVCIHGKDLRNFVKEIL